MLIQRVATCLALVLLIVVMTGCGGDPALHEITGKVTLGGKSYNRLLVYFRPIDQKVTKFNLGVGETDQKGELALRSTAGNGLAAGRYKVVFSCLQMEGSDKAVPTDEKVDDNPNMKVVELVPAKYATEDETPVEFEVKAGQNVFEFDIPSS